MLKGDERQRIDNAFSDFRCGLIGSQKLEAALREIHTIYELKISTQQIEITNLQTQVTAAAEKAEDQATRLRIAHNDAVYAERHRP